MCVRLSVRPRARVYPRIPASVYTTRVQYQKKSLFKSHPPNFTELKTAFMEMYGTPGNIRRPLRAREKSAAAKIAMLVPDSPGLWHEPR